MKHPISVSTKPAAGQKVAGTIAEISAAAGEQAGGIDEMSQAVAHLDEMTQANAALAEESAASAASLTGKIGQLNELVATFRTGEDSGTPASSRVSYAAPKQRANDHTAPRNAAEPARLQKLAEATFAQSRAAPAPVRTMAKRVSNGRGDAGWEEF